MYNSRGKQISRVRRRVISNPRSVYQAAQRAVLTTVQKAYAVMQPLVSQSFQNRSGAWENQARFGQLNNRLMREKWLAQEGFTSPDTIVNNLAQSYNQRDTLGALPNEYIISEGTLSFGISFFDDEARQLRWPSAVVSQSTYAEVVAALGIISGDQLTFATMLTDDGPNNSVFGQVTAFEFARIIMAPSGTDMSSPFFAETETQGMFTINTPNVRNKGRLVFQAQANGEMVLSSINGIIVRGGTEENCLGSAGVILSRREGDRWLYSTCQMVVNTGTEAINSERYTLGAAVESWQGDTDTEGTKYLEGAERNF